MGDTRKTLLGTDRLLDSDARTRREFLTSIGVDYWIESTLLRRGRYRVWSVGLGRARLRGCQVVNLRGAVVERGGKGLSFVESLQSDISFNVFSIVVLDGDRVDNVRARKKAAADERFFGVFFICEPDFDWEISRLMS